MNTVANAQKTVLALFYGRWRSQTLYAAVRLGVFEVIGRAARPAEHVARELDLDPARTYRLLRALASMAVLREHESQTFSITEAGELLRSDHPESMRDALWLREGMEHTAIWRHLPAIIRDGKESGFMREYGMSAFEYAARQPSYREAFDAGMSSQSALQTAWTIEALQSCDMSSIKHVCDVGGGQGYFLCHLLLRYPHLVGTVLERTSVISETSALWANRLRLNDRCTYIAGDMFLDVPTADAYTLKLILHDWDDEACVQILTNLCRRAVPGGRLFVIEHVIESISASDFAPLYDMHMMCWGTGRERTVQEYQCLLESSGWRFVATWFPSNRVIGVVEGALTK